MGAQNQNRRRPRRPYWLIIQLWLSEKSFSTMGKGSFGDQEQLFPGMQCWQHCQILCLCTCLLIQEKTIFFPGTHSFFIYSTVYLHESFLCWYHSVVMRASDYNQGTLIVFRRLLKLKSHIVVQRAYSFFIKNNLLKKN